MNTDNHPSTALNDPFQPATESGMTRRSFLKRTAATILVTVLAVNAFAETETAECGGESSVPGTRFPVYGSCNTEPAALQAPTKGAVHKDNLDVYHRILLSFPFTLFSPANKDADGNPQPSGEREFQIQIKAVHETAPHPSGPWIETNEKIETWVFLKCKNPDYEDEGDVSADADAESWELSSGSLSLALQAVLKYDNNEEPRAAPFKFSAYAILNGGDPENTGLTAIPGTGEFSDSFEDDFNNVPAIEFPNEEATCDVTKGTGVHFEEVEENDIPADAI